MSSLNSLSVFWRTSVDSLACALEMAVIMCEAGMLGNQTCRAEGEQNWTQHHLHSSGKWGGGRESLERDARLSGGTRVINLQRPDHGNFWAACTVERHCSNTACLHATLRLGSHAVGTRKTNANIHIFLHLWFQLYWIPEERYVSGELLLSKSHRLKALTPERRETCRGD